MIRMRLDLARAKPRALRVGWPPGLLIVALFCVGLLGAGCNVLPVTPTSGLTQRDALDAFTLEGRFSLRHGDKNYSGRLSWRHDGANNALNNKLLLASPFGQGIAEITTGANGARLTMADGKTHAAADVETLTQQLLGYALPLAQLTDWIRGRGADATFAGLAGRDAYGRPLRLRHDNWRVSYEYDNDDAQALPARLFAENADGMELRLRIDEWSSLDGPGRDP